MSVCKRNGFTVIELLVAAAVAFGFVLSISSVLVSFSNAGKLIGNSRERMSLLEKEIILSDILKHFSSRHMPRDSIGQISLTMANTHGGGSRVGSGSIFFIHGENPDFLGPRVKNEVVGMICRFDKSSGQLQVGWTHGSNVIVEYLKKHGAKNSPFDNYNFDLLIEVKNLRNVYLKPVYTTKYTPRKLSNLGLTAYNMNKIDRWNDGSLLDFTPDNMKKLVELGDSGEISRIYIVVKK
ncbi:MAG: hypothetical protein LBB18_01755 [Puniceicoccales bacterium]|nr:hypothetical protein [Puniceicoccales bacterium]